jgi:hypothetical protein
MDKSDKRELQLVTVDDPRFTATLNRRIGEMRHLLAVLEPASPAVALRTLRDAFPETPLEQRIRALTSHH